MCFAYGKQEQNIFFRRLRQAAQHQYSSFFKGRGLRFRLQNTFIIVFSLQALFCSSMW